MKTMITAVVILFFCSVYAYAHPPSEIALTYDPDTKMLHIDIKHVSDSLRKHHIRKLIIYKNDAEFKSFSYVTQKPPGLEEDALLDAEPGDTIRVKAVCSEAGSQEATLVIPDAEKKSP